MADEFKRIMEFFSMDQKEKEDRLQDVFEDSVEYFERFKHIMINGTPEEKQQAIENVMLMKKSIEEETQKICEKSGLSEKQLNQFTNNPENFPPEQWEAISKAKKKLDQGAQDIKKAITPEGESDEPRSGGPDDEPSPKRRRPRRRKGWGKI